MVSKLFLSLNMVSTKWLVILCILIGVATTPCLAGIKLDSQGTSFSSVIKAFNYQKLGAEVVLYEKTFPHGYNFGYITEQWFTSSLDGPFNEHARIRVYINNEETASLDYMLHMGQSLDIAALTGGKIWSSRLFGHLADGSYFNTFRIPFRTGIKVTVTNEVSTGALWYIIRGLNGIQLAVGSFTIPISARLRVYKQDKTLAPLEFVTLSNTTQKAGMLFLVTFDIQSPTPQFMEGCVRANIDNGNETTFLSSGTEDFFLSAFYFNHGEYHGYHSGLNYKSENSSGTHIVAYKFFVDDPVFFSKSFQLIWRNYEQSDGPNGCPSQFPANPNGVPKELPLQKRGKMGYSEPAKAHIQSYVWVYEWYSGSDMKN